MAYLFPKDGSTVCIKRVVGLPGDRVQMKGGVLQINGTPVKQERLEDAELQGLRQQAAAGPAVPWGAAGRRRLPHLR